MNNLFPTLPFPILPRHSLLSPQTQTLPIFLTYLIIFYSSFAFVGILTDILYLAFFYSLLKRHVSAKG